MESYIKSGHEGVVSPWFSFSTISCWHWTSTSVFVVTVTPSPCSPYCILSLWTCHFSVSCQRNTFCWGSAISVLCSQTPISLDPPLFQHITQTLNLCKELPHDLLPPGISEHNWGSLAFPGEEHGKGQHGPSEIPWRPTRCFPTPALTRLLENFRPHPQLWTSFLFCLLCSLSPWFSGSLVDFSLYPWCFLFLLSLTYRTSLMLVLSFNLFSCHRILFLLSYDFNFHFFVTPKSQFLFFIFLLDPSL